jgi:hypothetical protein
MNLKEFNAPVHLEKEGEEKTRCGRGKLWVKKTENPKWVTCKVCLKLIEKDKKNDHSNHSR